MRIKFAARFFVLGFFLSGLSLGAVRAATVGPAPLPAAWGLVLDGEQGLSGHPENGTIPYLFNLKLGPALYVSSYQFEVYGAVRYRVNHSRLGAGVILSRFIFEPQKRRSGLRFTLDGSVYSGGQVLGQGGFVLDLGKLVRTGFTVGIGNRPNDHCFFMTSLGTDLAAIARLIWKPKKPY